MSGAHWNRPVRRPSRAARLLPRLLAATLAVSAFALSAVAVTQVASGEPPLEHSPVPPSLAWLVPIIVDGTIVTGLAVTWLRRAGGWRAQWLPGLVAAVALAASVAVNLARVSPDLLPVDVLYAGVAALPPLALAATAYLGFAADPDVVSFRTPAREEPAPPAAPAVKEQEAAQEQKPSSRDRATGRASAIRRSPGATVRTGPSPQQAGGSATGERPPKEATGDGDGDLRAEGADPARAGAEGEPERRGSGSAHGRGEMA